jgi:hypothetical protein
VCAVRFGTKKAITRWPPLAVREYAEENEGADLTHYSVREVGQKVCQKHPLLKRGIEQNVSKRGNIEKVVPLLPIHIIR